MTKIHLGDKGTTQINKQGTRIPKGSNLVTFFALIDELNAYLNNILTFNEKKLDAENAFNNLPKPIEHPLTTRKMLQEIISLNSNIVASIYCKELKIRDRDINLINHLADFLENKYKATNFIWIYPTKVASMLNYARTLARVAENAFYKIPEKYLKDLDTTDIKAILNRESTIFFHLAIKWSSVKHEPVFV